MAYYKFTFRNKNKQSHSRIDKASSDVGRWQRSAELEKAKSKAKTRIKTATTKSGVNKKVIQSTTIYPDGTIVRADLVTTSNKLPKNFNSKSNSRGGKNGKRK